MRGVERKGCLLEGARALVLGSGGVGSAIAASLAAAGLAGLALFDASDAAAGALGERLRTYYPHLLIASAFAVPSIPSLSCIAELRRNPIFGRKSRVMRE